MKEKTIKRTIRIPERIYEILEEESKREGISINNEIMRIIGKRYGMKVEERKRGWQH